MSPPRDPDALSNSKIVFASACRKGWPRIEERFLPDKRSFEPSSSFQGGEVHGY